MLILTIVLAAFAPLMTKRKTVDLSSPWRYASNNSDIYYGLGNNQSAMIGKNSKSDDDANARLIINKANRTTSPHIVFKYNDTPLSHLIMQDSSTHYSYFLAGPYNSTTPFNNSGSNNVAFGYNSLLRNTSGYSNTAMGYIALANNKKGRENTAFGTAALSALGDGIEDDMPSEGTKNYHNTAVGAYAMQSTKQGERNTAIGSRSLISLVNGNRNTAVGYGALEYNEGSDNTAVGSGALSSNRVSVRNLAIGKGAMGNINVTDDTAEVHFLPDKTKYPYGSLNTAVGFEALAKSTKGHSNTAIGYKALYGAKEVASHRFIQANVAVGTGALYSLYDGYSNVAIGHDAMYKFGEGNDNIAIGSYALDDMVSGTGNIAIGSYALSSNEKGGDNIAIGGSACSGVKGSNKVCIGNGSGPGGTDNVYTQDTNRQKIIFLGDSSTVVYIPGHLVVDKYAMLGTGGKEYYTSFRLGPFDSATDYTVAGSFGYMKQDSDGLFTFSNYKSSSAGDANFDCFNPLARADKDGKAIDAMFEIKECSGTFNKIGTDDNQYTLRPVTNYAHPYKKFGIPKNQITGKAWTIEDVTLFSDKRLKNIKGESKAGLEQIRQLKVFDYTFKKDKEKTPHVGVIAQDLEKVFPKAVKKGEDGYLLIRQEDMFYAVINAVKQLDKLTQGIVNEIKIVLDKIFDLDTRVKALEAQNRQLKQDNANLKKDNEYLKKEIADINKRLKAIE